MVKTKGRENLVIIIRKIIFRIVMNINLLINKTETGDALERLLQNGNEI